jgi:predicted ABC-type ATPase
MGGHWVPEESIRRRYRRGLLNFFSLYRPLATTWRFYSSSQARRPRLIASGGISERQRVIQVPLWRQILKGISDEEETPQEH